jgi:hypothetical protein
LKSTKLAYGCIASFFCVLAANVSAQPITGVWKGKVKSEKLELKLIKNGDSLVGTAYYFDSKNSYRRYSIRGYFDGNNQDVVWWDDQLIEENGHSGSALFGGCRFQLSQ